MYGEICLDESGVETRFHVKDFSEKVALVTGSAKGLGAATARILSEGGADVIVSGPRDEEGLSFATKINSPYRRLDVAREADWADTMDWVRQRFGRLDILVNNAGIAQRSLLAGHETRDWEKTIAVNQTGVFFGMRAVAKLMINQGGGSIVNVSSVAAHDCAASSIAYTASKCAVIGMTKVAAKELGPYGIRVNALMPGLMETQMADLLDPDHSGRKRLMNITPLRRSGTPDEVAQVAAFLAGDSASFCTGDRFPG